MEIEQPLTEARVSIIIVNYCSEPLLEGCVSSVNKLTEGVEHEIVIVDNGRAGAEVGSASSSCRLLRAPINVGYAAANNLGIRATRAPYVLLLNPDTVMVNNAIQAMATYLDNHPTAGIVGCKLLNADGSLQFSCRSFPTFWSGLFNRYSLLTRLAPSNPFSRRYLLSDRDHNSVREVDWVSGACMMVRRKLLESIGLLDEKFFLYSEDVDLCYRVKRAGWKVVYVPSGIVTHYIGGSSAISPHVAIVERHRSLWTYYCKHMRRNWLVDAAVYLGIQLRCRYHVWRFVRKPLSKSAL